MGSPTGNAAPTRNLFDPGQTPHHPGDDHFTPPQVACNIELAIFVKSGADDDGQGSATTTNSDFKQIATAKHVCGSLEYLAAIAFSVARPMTRKRLLHEATIELRIFLTLMRYGNDTDVSVAEFDLRSLFTRRCTPLATVFACLLLTSGVSRAAEPLAAWNEGRSKTAILEFVDRVTKAAGPDFVPAAQRIAVFDNDGTLWCEQPMYVQLAFALDRAKSLAKHHPKSERAGTVQSRVEETTSRPWPPPAKTDWSSLVMATHAGMTTDEFSAHRVATGSRRRNIRGFTDPIPNASMPRCSSCSPSSGRTDSRRISSPAAESRLIRMFSERVYGVPPEQVIGSTIKTRFEVRDGKPVLVREAAVDFIDDKAGKPVAINKFIGRRPLMAFGNSDGDFEMLEWTTAGSGPRFGLIIHHTDAVREYAYDHNTLFGRLSRGLDEADNAAGSWWT